MSDIDTAVVDSLKVLDPEWPIREADMRCCTAHVCFRGESGHAPDITECPLVTCRFNRSMQHPLILPDAEVRIWRGMHGYGSCRSRRLSQERQRLDATVFPGEQISSVSLKLTRIGSPCGSIRPAEDLGLGVALAY